MTGPVPGVARLLTTFAIDGDGVAAGFVVEPGDLQARFVVEILADGFPVALVRADGHRADLDVGDGCYGFRARLAPGVIAHAERLEARLANTHRIVGTVEGPGEGGLPAPPGLPGLVRCDGGLRLSGWVDAAPSDPAPTVKALVEEVEVARAVCRGFAEADGGPRVVPAFQLDLPRDLADGRVRTVSVMAEDGTELSGSPCLVFALEDGFAGVIDAHAELESERARARFADGLLPQSVPFAEFDAWQARFPPPPAPATDARVLVLVVGEDELDATLASLEGQAGVDWSAAVFPARGSPVTFEPRLLRDLVGQGGADCDLVVAAACGTAFRPGALALLADAARHHPQSLAFYGDAVVSRDGRDWPVGLPAYDDEQYLEAGYCGLCFALRPAAVAAAAAAGCGSLYTLFPEVAADDRGGAGLPVHLPTPLARLPCHPAASLVPALREATLARLAGRGTASEATATADPSRPAVRVRRGGGRPRISVLVIHAGRPAKLERTLDALDAERTPAGVQVIVAHRASGGGEWETVETLARQKGCRTVVLRGLHSEAHLLNRAAAEADGDLLLSLHSGLDAADLGWLDELAGRCAPADVGAAAALVARPSGSVREAGFVLGPKFGAAHRFRDRHVDDGGYRGLLRVAHAVSAVSAACMMTPRRVFARLGGFDEAGASPVHHGIDYSLRLRAAGLRVLFTPHARLVDGGGDPVPRAATLLDAAEKRERGRLCARWRLVPGCDPFYSPWMAMDETPYSGLAWPPVPYEPRQPIPPETRPVPRDLA